jgi:hypothetical protein
LKALSRRDQPITDSSVWAAEVWWWCLFLLRFFVFELFLLWDLRLIHSSCDPCSELVVLSASDQVGAR